MQRTVLVVDDHTRIVEILRDYLEADGFGVRTAIDGATALALLQRETVDCVVLDVMMPGLDGFAVCRRIRAFSEVPVLFLSARDADSDKLRGLGLGDDYIVKNASPAEIVARVKTVLKRSKRGTSPPPGDAVLDFGRLVLDLEAYEAHVAGQAVALTAREFALLRLLAERPHHVVTKQQAFNLLWGGYGDENTLWGYVRRLREKIEEDPAQPRFILTVRGVGYRFRGRPALTRHRPAVAVSLRVWLALALVAIVVAPLLAGWGLGQALNSWRQQAEQARWAAVRAAVGGDVSRWHEPAWQGHAVLAFAALGVEVGLVDKRPAHGGLVFATPGAHRLMDGSGLWAAATPARHSAKRDQAQSIGADVPGVAPGTSQPDSVSYHEYAIPDGPGPLGMAGIPGWPTCGSYGPCLHLFRHGLRWRVSWPPCW